MSITFKKPIINSISSILEMRQSGTCAINWSYPTDFTNINSNLADNCEKFLIYRHIERVYPSSLATGGVNKPVDTYNLSSITNPPKFKLIAIIPITNQKTYNYIDDFDSLNVYHGDEGIHFNGTIWVDGGGNPIINDILYSKRRLYYKIIAVSKQMIFNVLPFIYLAHNNGVECRSAITQCKYNTLYQEGATIWYNNTLGNIKRVASDPIYDEVSLRFHNVWCCGNKTTVYCLNGRDGTIVRSYTFNFNEILSIRINPNNGNGIIVGDNSVVYECSLLNNNYTSIFATSDFINGDNTGLVVSKEGSNYKLYAIAEKQKVVKGTIGQDTSITYSGKLFGGIGDVTADKSNILGITNSTDGAIWVNGHIPAHLIKTAIQIGQKSVWYWNTTYCNGANSPTNYAIQMFNQAGNNGMPECIYGVNNPLHGYWETSTWTIVTANANTYFLQDIGYIYGIGLSNYQKTNGQPYNSIYPLGYPPGTVASYKPFTRGDRSCGWNGNLSQYEICSTPCDFPYNRSNGIDYNITPIPTESQLGLASDFSTSGLLSASNYNIWQTNNCEDKIHKLTWNGSVLTYNSHGDGNGIQGTSNVDWWSISDPTHITIDSQNSIWIRRDDPTYSLGLLYQITNGTAFPYQGSCRWPLYTNSHYVSSGITSTYIYGSPYNNVYIEYYLTRNISTTPLTACTITDGTYRNGYGLRISGTISEQIAFAKSWCETNYQSTGRLVYPNYPTSIYPANFLRDAKSIGDDNEYNSDSNGSLYISTEQQLYSDPLIIHPGLQYPSVELKIIDESCDPQLIDLDFWNRQIIVNNLSVSGYDDFTVTLSGNVIDSGSFEVSHNIFNINDKTQDYNGQLNPTSIMQNANNNIVSYTFHDPTILGKPKNRKFDNLFTNGLATITYVASVYNNAYYAYDSNDVVDANTISTPVSVTVFERWPTARFWVSGPTVIASGSIDDENTIYRGYSPLSATFYDYSIARTFPITGWKWDFDNGTSVVLTTTRTPTLCADDYTSTTIPVLTAKYCYPGKYYPTLYNTVAHSGTSSMMISSGVTNQSLMDWTPYATRTIEVLEQCPSVNFSIISARTVPSNYSDTNNGSIIVPTVVPTSALNSGSIYVTGYAPNLTIGISGCIVENSLPVSSITWDFSDPYNETDYLNYTTKYSLITSSDWCSWTGSLCSIKNTHTFIMPGYYDISLVAKTGIANPPSTFTLDCTGIKKDLVVCVKEIMPCPSFITIVSPGAIECSSTITFNPSTTLPGSFPIYKIDWEFGDNSEIISINRLASSSYYNSSAFSTDLSDPRNIIMTHDYVRYNTSISEDIYASISAYACNTNSVSTYSVLVAQLQLPVLSSIEGDIKLIDSRMYGVNNDTILVFEGEKSKTIYNVLLSAIGI